MEYSSAWQDMFDHISVQPPNMCRKRRSVARLTTAGLQVIGIGICSEAVSQFYPEYVVVNELEDLMREGYGKVSQQLRRARTG